MVAEPLARGPYRRPQSRTEVRPLRAPWTLMYHSVDRYEEDPYLLTVTPDRFAAQMRWLRRRGLRGVGIGELLDAHAAGRAAGLVGLTFDDGYVDFAAEVLPVLAECGFTASVYVVAERLGQYNAWDPGAPRKPLLTADQVRALTATGIEIGSHGLLHTSLVGLSRAALAAETTRSREILEDVIGAPVRGFCYPYGAVDARAARAVRTAGYAYACAIGHSAVTGRFALPRCYIGDRDGPWRLRAKQTRHRLRGLRTALTPGSRRGGALAALPVRSSGPGAGPGGSSAVSGARREGVR